MTLDTRGLQEGLQQLSGPLYDQAPVKAATYIVGKVASVTAFQPELLAVNQRLTYLNSFLHCYFIPHPGFFGRQANRFIYSFPIIEDKIDHFEIVRSNPAMTFCRPLNLKGYTITYQPLNPNCH